MKKKLLSILIAVCMVIFILPLTVAAQSDVTFPTTTVTIDVGGAVCKTDDYEITSTMIKGLKKNVNYVLTGTTNKSIGIWGANEEENHNPFYFTLNNVTLKGGIITQNSPTEIKINVPENTNNILGDIRSQSITIQGKGTLNTTSLVVIQKTTYIDSALYVKDTKLNLGEYKNDGSIAYKTKSTLEGDITFAGDAVINAVGSGKDAIILVGQTSRQDVNFYMKDNAKFYILQEDAKTNDYDDAIVFFQCNKFVMSDNSYLEAKSCASGYAFTLCGNMQIKDNATLKATANSLAFFAYEINLDGGKIISESQTSNAIYAYGLSVKNAEVNAVSNASNAILVDGILKIANSRLTAKSLDGIKAVVARERVDGPKNDTPTEQDDLIKLGDNTGEINSSKIKTTDWEYVEIENYGETYWLWQRLSYFVDDKGEGVSNVIIDTLYPVTYNAGKDGKGDTKTVNKVKADDLTLENALFTRDGYTQIGWATEDGGKKIYELGAKYTEDKAITLYPVWEKNATADNNTNGKNDNNSDKNINVDKNTTSPKTFDDFYTLFLIASLGMLSLITVKKIKNVSTK